ncbi:hypothetical protein P8452_58918 [Trifolium repens]|nr:hypothetical protein P8452_58918 [Trifolium repens]
MSYLSVLVLFLGVITLTLARNHNHQIHEENARSNIVLIRYQPPNPQKPVALDYGPSSGPNQQQRLRRRKLQRGPPRVNIPSVPGRSPERPNFTLTTARNLKHHQEVAAGSNGLINYHSHHCKESQPSNSRRECSIQEENAHHWTTIFLPSTYDDPCNTALILRTATSTTSPVLKCYHSHPCKESQPSNSRREC